MVNVARGRVGVERSQREVVRGAEVQLNGDVELRLARLAAVPLGRIFSAFWYAASATAVSR